MRLFTGTPEYMSPEQWASSDETTVYGCPIDCWALGVLMYNMLAGQQPFDPGRSGDEEAISARVSTNCHTTPARTTALRMHACGRRQRGAHPHSLTHTSRFLSRILSGTWVLCRAGVTSIFCPLDRPLLTVSPPPSISRSPYGIQIMKNEWNMTDPRWEHVSTGARELIRALIEPNPSNRSTARQVCDKKFSCDIWRSVHSVSGHCLSRGSAWFCVCVCVCVL